MSEQGMEMDLGIKKLFGTNLSKEEGNEEVSI